MQLQRLRPAWDGCETIYVTTKREYQQDVEADAKRRSIKIPKFYTVTPATRWEKFRMLRQLCEISFILLKERPDVLITTGAAPGYFALRLGKMLGARTIWVDSIANAEELSLSGQKVKRFADLWLTQWEHLSGSDETVNPAYLGAVV